MLPTGRRPQRPSADAIFGILALAAAGCGSAAVFLAELLAGKMLLPHFGGSPATWIVCLAFFQVTLVAAYAFANVLAIRARPGWQILVQAALIVAAIIAMLAGTGGPTSGRFADMGAARFPGLAVAAEQATLVGLPFFAVADNAGSPAELLAYPFLIEALAAWLPWFLGWQRPAAR